MKNLLTVYNELKLHLDTLDSIDGDGKHSYNYATAPFTPVCFNVWLEKTIARTIEDICNASHVIDSTQIAILKQSSNLMQRMDDKNPVLSAFSKKEVTQLKANFDLGARLKAAQDKKRLSVRVLASLKTMQNVLHHFLVNNKDLVTDTEEDLYTTYVIERMRERDVFNGYKDHLARKKFVATAEFIELAHLVLDPLTLEVFKTIHASLSFWKIETEVDVAGHLRFYGIDIDNDLPVLTDVVPVVMG